MTSIYDLMKRYVGHRVSIMTHSQTRLVGEVASIHDDGVRLTNTLEHSESEDHGWYAQICHAHPEDDARPRHAESLVSWHAILAATCLDDDIVPPQASSEDKVEDDAPDPFVIVNTDGDLTAYDSEGESQQIPTDRFLLEIGAQLIPLMATEGGRPMVEQIRKLRRRHANQAGWSFPTLRVRDNLKLSPNGYRVLINGCQVASSQAQPDCYLAISTDETDDPLEGQKTTEPAFGLTAYWIDGEQRHHAELLGYTVVDPPAVIVTHLAEVLRRYGAELLGYEHVQQLLDDAEQVTPTVVRELTKGTGSLPTIHYVLRRLLEEGISLKGLVSILECLGHHKRTSSDLENLTSAVRVSIGRQICEPFRDHKGRVRAVVFHPAAERRLAESFDVNLDDDTLERVLKCLSKRFSPQEKLHEGTALLVDTSLRYRLRKQIARALPDVPVIAYQEIPSDLMLHPLHVIQLNELDSVHEATDNSLKDNENPAGKQPTPKITGFAQPAIPRQPR